MNSLFVLLFLGSAIVLQLNAAPMGGNSMTNGQMTIDPLVALYNLPNLDQQLNQNDSNSLVQVSRYCSNSSVSQCHQEAMNWYNQLNPQDQQVAQNWAMNQMSTTQMVQQTTMQVLNQNNISQAVKSAIQNMQQNLSNPQLVPSVMQSINSLSSSDKSQLEQVLRQIYGNNLIDFVMNMQKNPNSVPFYSMIMQNQ
ncbi:hypothetical protein FO519_008229 [Halicephalobus sp. NKZ332]|nr:hypothetical protein FO519_008229 [Halicephalobus sp. NKZ332]